MGTNHSSWRLARTFEKGADAFSAVPRQVRKLLDSATHARCFVDTFACNSVPSAMRCPSLSAPKHQVAMYMLYVRPLVVALILEGRSVATTFHSSGATVGG